jgi:TonB family protein
MRISNALSCSFVMHGGIFAGVYTVISVLQQESPALNTQQTPLSIEMVYPQQPDKQKALKVTQKGPKSSHCLSAHKPSQSFEKPSSTHLIADPNNVYPVYPESAKASKIEGSFLIELILNSKGSVESLTFLEGDCGQDIFKQTIETALKQWKFKGSENALNHAD